MWPCWDRDQIIKKTSSANIARAFCLFRQPHLFPPIAQRSDGWNYPNVFARVEKRGIWLKASQLKWENATYFCLLDLICTWHSQIINTIVGKGRLQSSCRKKRDCRSIDERPPRSLQGSRLRATGKLGAERGNA